MNAREWRANLAGWCDASDKLLGSVENIIQSGMAEQRVSCPQAIFDQINEAQERIRRVSDWLVSDVNATLER